MIFVRLVDKNMISFPHNKVQKIKHLLILISIFSLASCKEIQEKKYPLNFTNKDQKKYHHWEKKFDSLKNVHEHIYYTHIDTTYSSCVLVVKYDEDIKGVEFIEKILHDKAILFVAPDSSNYDVIPTDTTEKVSDSLTEKEPKKQKAKVEVIKGVPTIVDTTKTLATSDTNSHYEE